MIPHGYVHDYDSAPVPVVKYDQDTYPFINVGNHSIYFPRDMSPSSIHRSYFIARIEQDYRSPHRYLANEFNFTMNDTAVLVGASDGMFAIEMLNHVGRMHLFEADERWLPCLERTMAPFRDRVILHNTTLGCSDSGIAKCLDSVLNGERINYLQVDVEGDEIMVLRGAVETISISPRLSMAICCYHRHNHACQISEFALNAGFQYRFSPGYIIPLYQYLKRPYLRHGVLYAWK